MINQLDELERMLKERGIPYTRIDQKPICGTMYFGQSAYDGRHQIIVYPTDEDRLKDSNQIFDAICHYGSYGYEDRLLEIMGKIIPEEQLQNDSVMGWLTAEDVMNMYDDYINL